MYLYNGKELNTDFGLDMLDYGARWYDPSIGRWHSIDPLAEKYSSISPFVYVANNPLKFIDPDGRKIVLPNANQGKVLATDLNKIYENKYGVSGAFKSVTRDVTRTIDNPNRSWWNPFSWGEPKTVEVTESKTFIETTEEFDGIEGDKYTEQLKEVIDSDSEIGVEFLEDKGAKAGSLTYGPQPDGFVEGVGGGYTASSRKVYLSDALKQTSTTDKKSNLLNWTIGGVALHEILYHVHPDGRSESSPNDLRNHYEQRTGSDHPAGNRQNRRIGN